MSKKYFCLALLFALTPPAWAEAAKPLPIPETETANYRWLHKAVLESRLLDDLEKTNTWSHLGVGEMSLTAERAKDGKHSLRLQSPTKTANKLTGRPSGECGARRNFEGEDWSGYNRLSFWVYPHLPGFKVISMLVKLRNAGATTVPDSYNREGLNYFLLQPDQWNQVVWEIPHLARDKVTGADFIYRLQGNEPGATNIVCFDLDHFELQRVEADHFEGWAVAPGKISFSHGGYLSGAPKTALANGLPAKDFKVIEQNSGKAVLVKPHYSALTLLGEFQLLSFSEIETPGVYGLQAGDLLTPWFPIGPDVWRNSILKTINFFYCERCGAAIPGIHDVCHQDWQAVHGDRKIVINGGWHDAGDLSQGLVNTAEAAYAMLALAEEVRQSDPPLTARLLEEARWGLDWLQKTRFGDGFRVTWATMDYWTDGVLGTPDDTMGDARNSAFDNFLAAATEGLAGRVF